MSEQRYRKVVLTVEIVPPAERDKFRALSRPETYHRIRPHTEVGERGAYAVEMTDEEYRRALGDAENPESNLIAAELPQPLQPHVVPNRPNLEYVGLRKLAANGYGRGAGVIVGVIDGGLSPALRDRVFAGRIAAAEDFISFDGPYANTDPHGSWMASLAVPPAAQLAVAKIYTPTDYGSSSILAEAIYWMADTAHADVINMSIGGIENQTILSDAVEYAAGEGILLLASAGNDGIDVVHYPAGYSDVLAISNYDHRTDAIAPSSSYGAHIWAAAGGIDHTFYAEDGSEWHIEDGGTSAACAMATRVAAYFLSIGISAGATKSELASSARSTGAGAIYEGNGVLQLVSPYKGKGALRAPSGEPAQGFTEAEYREVVRSLVDNLSTENDLARSDGSFQQWAKERAETGLVSLARHYPEIRESRRLLNFWPTAAMRGAINEGDREAFRRALRRYMVLAKHEAVWTRRRRSGMVIAEGTTV